MKRFYYDITEVLLVKALLLRSVDDNPANELAKINEKKGIDQAIELLEQSNLEIMKAHFVTIFTLL